MNKKTKVLFVCTNNSARSQMAEGILRHLYGDLYEVYSAGTDPTMVNPLGIAALKEIGIDISHHRSKGISELGEMNFDVAVTVCDRSNNNCPFVPGAKMTVHRSFADPDDPASFRKVRDEIKQWIAGTFRDPSAFDHPGLIL